MSENQDMAALARIGGYARAASMTPEELSVAGRNAVNARWAREAERREAEGRPPLRPTPSPLDPESMSYWLEVVDERYPDRAWRNRMERRRLAVRLARLEAARLAEEAFRRGGGRS